MPWWRGPGLLLRVGGQREILEESRLRNEKRHGAEVLGSNLCIRKQPHGGSQGSCLDHTWCWRALGALSPGQPKVPDSEAAGMCLVPTR